MSVKIQNQDILQEIENLKKGEIGQVICQGLAELVKNKPQFPIDYLSKWLFNINNDKKNLQQYQDSFREKELYLQKMKQQEITLKILQEKYGVDQEKLKQQDDEFMEKVKNHSNHREFMETQYPQRIQEKFGLTGVYIGHVETVGEEKQIKYFGFSQNQNFMDQRILPKDQGVTYGLLKDEVAQEEGEEGEKKEKKNYIFVPNVVQDPRIYYFRIPKLGSYLAIKLTYNSFLNENKFKDSVQAKTTQINSRADLKLLMEEREQAYKKDISECEPDQLEEINTQYNLQKEQDLKALNTEIILPSEKQEYIVAMDTLGQDKAIDQKDIEEILKNVQFYSEQWQQKELELWNADIDNYLKYQEKINKETQQIYERFCEAEEIYVKQNIGNLDKWSNYEKIYEYEQNALRLEKIKKQLKSQEVQEWFQIMAQYQVVQYPELLKIILVFMGYSKEEIIIKNSDKLDWIKYRSLFNNDEFIQKIINYNHRGAKPEKLQPEMKIQQFNKQIENFNEQDINEYNLAMGRLFKWIQFTCKCRISDVQARRELKEESKQNKIKAEQAKKEWDQQKEQYVQKALEQLPEEEKPNFDKVATEQEYDSLYPDITIPVEIPSDDDGDFE